MPRSVYSLIMQLKTRLRMANGVDIKLISLETGMSLNRKKEITPVGLKAFVDTFDPSMRVASFNHALSKIFGAQINARVETYLGGKPVDGRLSVANLI